MWILGVRWERVGSVSKCSRRSGGEEISNVFTTFIDQSAHVHLSF